MVILNRHEDGFRQTPFFQHACADFLVIKAEYFFLGLHHRHGGNPFFIKHLQVFIGHAEIKDDNTNVLEKRRDKNIIAFLLDGTGNKICCNGRSHRSFPEDLVIEAFPVIRLHPFDDDKGKGDIFQGFRAQNRQGFLNAVDFLRKGIKRGI